jgi:hypothetical protein
MAAVELGGLPPRVSTQAQVAAVAVTLKPYTHPQPQHIPTLLALAALAVQKAQVPTTVKQVAQA